PGNGSQDPVLDCVRFLARAWRKADSPSTLTAGLPLKDGLMDVSLIEAAFARIGVTVRPVNDALARFKDYDFPAILLPGDRPPLVILRKIGWRMYRVYDPLIGAEQNVDARTLGARRVASFLCAFPNFENVQDYSGHRFARS